MNTISIYYNLLHPSFGIVEEIFCIAFWTGYDPDT